MFLGVLHPSISSTWGGGGKRGSWALVHERLHHKPTQNLIPTGVGRDWAHRCLSSSVTPGVDVPCPGPPAPHKPHDHPPAPAWGWQSRQLAEVPMPPCQPGPRGTPLLRQLLQHVPAPKPACPGTLRLAQAAGREGGTAATVPGKSQPGTGAHCSILGKKRLSDGRCPADGSWEPQKCWGGLCSPFRLTERPVPAGTSQCRASSLLLTPTMQPSGPPHL